MQVKTGNDHEKDKAEIDSLIVSFFEIFTNTDHKQPDWMKVHSICIPETIILD
jgi:hypothetical protein